MGVPHEEPVRGLPRALRPDGGPRLPRLVPPLPQFAGRERRDGFTLGVLADPELRTQLRDVARLFPRGPPRNLRASRDDLALPRGQCRWPQGVDGLRPALDGIGLAPRGGASAADG